MEGGKVIGEYGQGRREAYKYERERGNTGVGEIKKKGKNTLPGTKKKAKGKG